MGKTEEEITNRAVTGNMKFKEFLYRLFFTRDDSLDVLQMLFSTIVVVALLVVWGGAVSDVTTESVKIEGLVTLRWLTGLLVITAVPKWLVPFMSKHTKEVGDGLKKRRGNGYNSYGSSDIHEGNYEIPDEPTEETSQ